jgi:hypothetical protein
VAGGVGSNALGCRRALVMQARKVPRPLTSKRLSDLTLAPLLSMLRCVCGSLVITVARRHAGTTLELGSPPIDVWRFSPHYVGRDDDTNGNDGSRRITRDILHADHESVPRERRRRSIHNACVLCVSPLFVRLQVCLQVCLQVRCANAVPPNRGGPREVCLGSMTGRTFGLGNADAGKTLRSARPVGRIPGMRAGCATNRSPCSS